MGNGSYRGLPSLKDRGNCADTNRPAHAPGLASRGAAGPRQPRFKRRAAAATPSTPASSMKAVAGSGTGEIVTR